MFDETYAAEVMGRYPQRKKTADSLSGTCRFFFRRNLFEKEGNL